MSIIFLNGEYREDNTPLISHKDCGFTTGIGIFDSMLAKDNALIHGREHFERLVHDAKIVIDLIPNMSFEGFQNICAELLEKNKLQKDYARIRTTITGGIVKSPLAPAHTPTILIDIAATASPNKVGPAQAAIITDFPRIARCTFENCKRLDYSRSYAARRKAENLGADEAILTNTDGNIACGATSNIFIEENGVMITPPLSDGVLAGITRRKLIEGGNIREESIPLARLNAADKIFLTNSFIGLRPAKLVG